MGKKGVEDMINEIEVFIESCKFQTLSSTKIVVQKDELMGMLEELKVQLPGEIERCKKIMRNKEAILASARTRSDAIISESVNEANRLVDTNHITELANLRAGEIVESARKQADQIVADANNEATSVRLGAMTYTKDKITELKNFLDATLQAENENYKNLVDSLENSVYTLESNISEVDSSIGLINGNVDYSAQYQNNVAEQLDDTDDDYEYDDFDEEPIKSQPIPEAEEDEDDYDDLDDDDDDFLDD